MKWNEVVPSQKHDHAPEIMHVKPKAKSSCDCLVYLNDEKADDSVQKLLTS